MTFDVAAVRARFTRTRPRPRLLRRPRRLAGAGRGDRRGLELLPHLEREHERPVRDQPPHRGARRPRARDRRPLPRLRLRRDRLRPEHDDAELRSVAHRRPRVQGGRRDRLHQARPRRQRVALARARARQGPDRPVRRHQRGHDARPRRPPAAARPTARASSRSRSRRTRSARSPTSAGSPTSPTRRARSPGPTPCTTRRTGRSTSRNSASTC